MNKKIIILIAVLVALVIAGILVFAGGTKPQPEEPKPTASASVSPTNADTLVAQEAGTYTLGSTYRTVQIKAGGITLQDGSADDITVDASVGDGEVTLLNVKAKNLRVLGGGQNSIKLMGNSAFDAVYIQRVDGVVRVYAKDGVEIKEAYVEDGSDDVILQGAFNNLSIQASDIAVSVREGSKIGACVVNGSKTQLTFEKGTKLDQILVSSQTNDTKILLDGEAQTVDIAGKNVNTSVNGSGKITNYLVNTGAMGGVLHVEAAARVNTIASEEKLLVTGTGKVQKIIERQEYLVSAQQTTTREINPQPIVKDAQGNPVPNPSRAPQPSASPSVSPSVSPSSSPSGTPQPTAKPTATPAPQPTPVVVRVQSISLSPSDVTLAPKEKVRLYAQIAPSNATDLRVSWASGNEEIATVNDSGIVTARQAGSVKIYAKTKDGGKSAFAIVRVVQPIINVNGVRLDRSESNLMVGETQQLTATVLPANASYRNVRWESSDTNVATVNDKGLITAKAAGKARITIHTSDGDFKAACTVTVSPQPVPVTGVTLDQTQLALLAGEGAQLTATVQPENADNKTVSWSSSNPAIAAVDAQGKVAAISAGQATITVTTQDSGKTATCTVTVSPQPVPVTGVTLDQTQLALLAGEGAQLTATVQPENADNKTVSWSSSNPAIAAVDAQGKVAAISAGQATITVTTQDSGKTATCTVQITAPRQLVWDGTTPSATPAWYQASGDRVVIGDAQALAWFAAQVNSGVSFSGKTVSFDLGEESKILNLNAQEWTPIGFGTASFDGIFDGSGITVTQLKQDISDGFSGLFGRVRGATLRNITLEDGNITLRESAQGGAIAGLVLEGTTVENCTAAGKMEAVALPDRKNAGVGGLVGVIAAESESTATVKLSGCISNMLISAEGSGNYAGGMVGRTDGARKFPIQIMQNSNQGNIQAKSIAGGMVGQAVNTDSAGMRIEQCVNTGDISGIGQDGQAGGILGSASKNTTIADCYNTGRITGQIAAGGICGADESGDLIVRNSYHAGAAVCPSDQKSAGIVGESASVDLKHYAVDLYLQGSAAGALYEGVDKTLQPDVAGSLQALSKDELQGAAGLLNNNQTTGVWRAAKAGENGGFPVLTWQK